MPNTEVPEFLEILKFYKKKCNDENLKLRFISFFSSFWKILEKLHENYISFQNAVFQERFCIKILKNYR